MADGNSETQEYASTTTLARIRAANPCEDGWRNLLAHVGKTRADDEPLFLRTVLDSNGIDDALWVLAYAMPDDRLARHFQAWCAEQVLPLFERAHPNDGRVRSQVEMLRRDDATPAERDAACGAAWFAAWTAARAGVETAAGTAAGDAARYAVWAAARAAARDAARAAARDAVEDAAAWHAARAAQESELRRLLEMQASVDG